MLSEFVCMANLPLGDASALVFSSPLPAMIFSKIFLGHSLRMYKAVSGLVLYIGVMLVVKPTFLFHSVEEELSSHNDNIGDLLDDEQFLEVNNALNDSLEEFSLYSNYTNSTDLDNRAVYPGDHSYLLGVMFGLLGATSRAAHYVTCKVVYDTRPDSTDMIVMWAGVGGGLVSLLSSCVDSDHLVLSLNIGHIRAVDWSIILLIACLGKLNIKLLLQFIYFVLRYHCTILA